MALNLENDIAWHRQSLADCRAGIVAVEADPESLSRAAELYVLREQEVRLVNTLEHLERLQRLTKSIASHEK